METRVGNAARSLGRQGLSTFPVGLGCMGMSQDYGPADEQESIATIQRAVDLGVTLIDTSMSYGAGGNERLVGRALAGRRDEVVLATKFGIVRDVPGGPARVSCRPEDIPKYCDASLSRLNVDHIDLYYMHRIDPQVPIEETIGAMAELVTAGKVRYLGVSETGPEELTRAFAVHPITAVQFEWSMWWRDPEDDVVPAARRLGVGLVPYSPLGRGFLTGADLGTERLTADDDRHLDPRLHGEHLARNRAILDRMRQLAAELQVTPAQLALSWLLAQGDDVVPIPGTTRRSRLGENVRAATINLSRSDLERLDEVAPRHAWSGDRQTFAPYRTVRRPTQ
ncbi:oxidoreductase [Micromonospora humidisoli]|uniref:Aldo/keto reductase n=1 Tax=Micromonospora humidisoli TaxID=2807622 RepID=A0ABS2JJK8_9ACTN|nr:MULTISPECIES: aldo/keto reductase [Micromonospora]MBM7086668.1 aldo/keto reductase [Micromonospora humidisoli]GHJ11321.1 oxidoreductase [Micromonospora sp. AKA109]